MNNRTTPETDAFAIKFKTLCGEKYWVPVDIARKLERERDEAREAAERWESSSDAMERAGAEQARRADENREWALKAERERDEAREELEEYRSIAENIGAIKAVSEKEKAIRERDEARTELEEAQMCLKKAITELDLASVEIFKWERDFMIVVNDFKTVVKQLKK